MGMDMNHALILAGGLGQRLWPISRKQSATKEGVDIHSQTMLELTISRVSQWVPRQRIWVVSSRSIETYGCRLIKEPFRKTQLQLLPGVWHRYCILIKRLSWGFSLWIT